MPNSLTNSALNNTEVEQFINTIKEHSYYDLSGYSRNSLVRRLEKISSDLNMPLFSILVKMNSDKLFFEEIINRITVNTTAFFRDSDVWLNLYQCILMQLKSKDKIRIWHAGCSTGEEVYSMLLMLSKLGIADRVEICATDINQAVINVAKKGNYVYSKNIDAIERMNLLTQDEQINGFQHHYNGSVTSNVLQFKSNLSTKVAFKQHDLCKEQACCNLHPFDLILCRNVMIYFDLPMQNKILEMFWNHLSPNGSLLVGKDESIVGPMIFNFEKKGFYYQKVNYDDL